MTILSKYVRLQQNNSVFIFFSTCDTLCSNHHFWKLLVPFDELHNLYMVMCISHKGNYSMNFQIDVQWVEQASEFKYLGSLILEDRYCEKEIHSRIALEKQIFMDKKIMFTGTLNLELKMRILQCLVWSVALYAAETWTLTQADKVNWKLLKCGSGKGWRK